MCTSFVFIGKTGLTFCMKGKLLQRRQNIELNESSRKLRTAFRLCKTHTNQNHYPYDNIILWSNQTVHEQPSQPQEIVWKR